jgi:hypothetical protein
VKLNDPTEQALQHMDLEIARILHPSTEVSLGGRDDIDTIRIDDKGHRSFLLRFTQNMEVSAKQLLVIGIHEWHTSLDYSWSHRTAIITGKDCVPYECSYVDSFSSVDYCKNPKANPHAVALAAFLLFNLKFKQQGKPGWLPRSNT